MNTWDISVSTWVVVGLSRLLGAGGVLARAGMGGFPTLAEEGVPHSDRRAAGRDLEGSVRLGPGQHGVGSRRIPGDGRRRLRSGILWAVVGGDFGGYGKREEETATGLGYGFIVSSLVFLMAGAALTQRLGGPLTDLVLFGAGAIGAVLALIWVPLMEADGVGGLNASTTWSLETLVPGIPPRVLYVVATAASVAAAVRLES